MKNIILDVDGVLLNWVDPFVKWVEKKYGMTPNPDFYPHIYNVASWYGISYEEGLALVNEFNASGTLLQALPGTKRFIKQLKANFWRIHIVTACGKAQVEFRLKNLECVFGKDFIASFSHVEPYESKEKELQKFDGSGYIFIDDHIRHVQTGLNMGLSAILMTTPQNSHLPTPSGAGRLSKLKYKNINI